MEVISGPELPDLSAPPQRLADANMATQERGDDLPDEDFEALNAEADSEADANDDEPDESYDTEDEATAEEVRCNALRARIRPETFGATGEFGQPFLKHSIAFTCHQRGGLLIMLIAMKTECLPIRRGLSFPPHARLGSGAPPM